MDVPADSRTDRSSVPRASAGLPALVGGAGPWVVLLHGYGLCPRTYLDTVERLAERTRVLAPAWLDTPGRWSYPAALDALEATLDAHRVRRATLVAHSFAGALAVGLAARNPNRMAAVVLSDSLALNPRAALVRKAPSWMLLYRLATRRAAVDFLRSCLTRPADLLRAGWWGFISDRSDEIAAVTEARLACHVLWSERDTLVRREDGRILAGELHADFTVVSDPDGRGPVDHDWVFRHPGLVVRVLDELGLLPDSPSDSRGSDAAADESRGPRRGRRHPGR